MLLVAQVMQLHEREEGLKIFWGHIVIALRYNDKVNNVGVVIQIANGFVHTSQSLSFIYLYNYTNTYHRTT